MTFNIKKFWRESWIFIFLITAIFIAGILIGFILPNQIKLYLIQITLNKFDTILQGADNPWLLGLRIFLNNLIVTGVIFLSSFFILVPIIILLINGMIIGIFLHFCYYLDAVQPGILKTTILSLIPHGIFELPAFILSAVFGTQFVIKLLAGKKMISQLNRVQSIFHYLKKFIFIIIPLLIIAALMETTVSDYILRYFDIQSSKQSLNPALQVVVPASFLKRYQCQEENQSAKLQISSSIRNIGQAIYDPQWQTTWKNISQKPYWQDAYLCNNNTFKITSFFKTDYSLHELKDDQKTILNKLHFDTLDLDTASWQSKIDNKIAYYKIITTDTKIILISWEGNSIEPLLTLEDSLL